MTPTIGSVMMIYTLNIMNQEAVYTTAQFPLQISLWMIIAGLPVSAYVCMSAYRKENFALATVAGISFTFGAGMLLNIIVR